MKEKNKSSKLTFLDLFEAFLPVAAVKKWERWAAN